MVYRQKLSQSQKYSVELLHELYYEPYLYRNRDARWNSPPPDVTFGISADDRRLQQSTKEFTSHMYIKAVNR